MLKRRANCWKLPIYSIKGTGKPIWTINPSFLLTIREILALIILKVRIMQIKKQIHRKQTLNSHFQARIPNNRTTKHLTIKDENNHKTTIRVILKKKIQKLNTVTLLMNWWNYNNKSIKIYRTTRPWMISTRLNLR